MLFSALQEGDGDMAESVALDPNAASAPTLIDEALATKNGLHHERCWTTCHHGFNADA